ncbi:rod shape-determining protein MreC [Asaia lannensis]|uniref:Cell shape-determining protein MreC n=1 Tax=Asaia lannensis NBRC 102526 TaxID=1307926 RepID=A0ABT1CHQ2_9PROT|nr:rod shape-determining protein MreC [Asaia lannensis]MCO6160384.1 rod shape-determining protein MreC [Asaia lannensis NBRC 102526]GBQ97825.1 rod shape-determining protein MreC [Asaia lannensis NBRC 102526]
MLSIQGRHALAKLMLPFFFVLAIGLIMLGLTRRPAVDALRMRLADGLSPAYKLLAAPENGIAHIRQTLVGLTDMAGENARLRAENQKLRRWYDVAVAMANENAQLKASLHWIPDNAPNFVSGHALRDAGGLYGRSVLLAVGEGHNIVPGDVALDAAGLLGRVTETGDRTVRILMINDEASRIPVMLTASRGNAIMAGDGSPYPRLIYYAQDNRPVEGERVVTGEQPAPEGRDHGGFAGMPGGLIVGTVHYLRPGSPVVIPEASLDHPDIIRVFNYMNADHTGPDAPGRVRIMPSMPVAPELPFIPFQKPIRGQG